MKKQSVLRFGIGVMTALIATGCDQSEKSAVAKSSGVVSNESEKLHQLFEDYWAFEMRENPFAATASGEPGYDSLVPQIKSEDFQRRTAARQKVLEKLLLLDMAELSSDDKLSADLLHFILKHDIALSKHNSWRTPFLADGGFHSDIGYIVSSTPFRNEQDYQNYINRLRVLPGYLDQNVQNMRQGLQDGFTQPQQILPTILPSFEAQVTDTPEAHPLYRPFVNISDTLDQETANRLQSEGADVIHEAVIPAYDRVLTFMKDEYMPAAVDKVGALYLPGGEEYYADLVRYYTTLDSATPEDIHQLGLREVARIRAEMDEVIKETGFEGSFKEFQNYLRTDEQFYAETADELLYYAAWVAKDIDGRLPAFFGKLPRQPYSVEPVPAAIAPNYTTGRYVGAARDADRGGQYWVNTYALDKRPLYQIVALTLHEATPGHHLQGALSLEIENAPKFRSQFYPHAFGEGWGLYSEKLGVEMGVYQTPYDDFGRLSYEMWRACRLVIDTGIHSKGWTREQAMDYLASNTALSLHNVQTEVDRYIAWPGQALAYKVGELTIWELRSKAEKELGEQFDIRDFHDTILSAGGMPMEILRMQVDKYIEEAKIE